MSSRRDQDQYNEVAAVAAGVIVFAVVAAVVAVIVGAFKIVSTVHGVYATHGRPGQAGYVPLRLARNRLLKTWAIGALPFVIHVAFILNMAMGMLLLAKLGFDKQVHWLMNLPIPSNDWTVPFALIVWGASTIVFVVYVAQLGARLGPAVPTLQQVGALNSYMVPFAAPANGAVPGYASMTQPLAATPAHANGHTSLHSPA